MEEQDQEMRFAELFLEATTLIAPLLGLIGTVFGLIRLLSSMGPQLLLPPGGSFSGFGDVLISTALGLVVSLIAMVTLHLNHGLRQWQQSLWRRDLHRHVTP
ncbi:MAG: MotA/TolQ/ExbB proton channel family protein [Cyanobacteriota bacterium]|nr:MotA/TolQ/ExbB proton channel family protein [Cyanobacteriota bacterium]